MPRNEPGAVEVSTGPPPDPGERALHFGCGALFGLIIGIGACLGQVDASGLQLLIIAGAMLAFGLAAMFGGHRFWDSLRHFNRWT